jgi:hypothetical protein
MATKPPSDVDAFFALLDHPHHGLFEAIRRAILSADPRIVEGIKWKVPSFRTDEYFATLHLRTKQGAGVILHFGPKKRDDLTARAAIADPASLLTWLADDRAVVLFKDQQAFDADKDAFVALIREWITHVRLA